MMKRHVAKLLLMIVTLMSAASTPAQRPSMTFDQARAKKFEATAPDGTPGVVVISPTTAALKLEAQSSTSNTQSTTAWTSAGLGASASPGDAAWSVGSGGSAITASDDIRASINSLANGASTELLQATDFGFAIPSNATIDGVEVRVERFSTIALNDTTAQLLHGGSALGTNQSAGALWPTSETYNSFGGAADLWGTGGITPAQVNASTFGFQLAAINNGASSDVRVDHIQIRVTYTETVASSYELEFDGSTERLSGRHGGADKFQFDDAGVQYLPEQASAPGTPASGWLAIYPKSDGLYVKDDAGTETGPLGTGGGGGSGIYGYITTSTNTTVPNGASASTAVIWDAEDFDIDSQFSAGSSPDNLRVYINSAGWYRFSATVDWTSNSTGIRTASLDWFDASNSFAQKTFGFSRVNAASVTITGQIVTGAYYFDVGDYVSLLVGQTSGANTTVRGSGLTLMAWEKAA